MMFTMLNAPVMTVMAIVRGGNGLRASSPKYYSTIWFGFDNPMGDKPPKATSFFVEVVALHDVESASCIFDWCAPVPTVFSICLLKHLFSLGALFTHESVQNAPSAVVCVIKVLHLTNLSLSHHERQEVVFVHIESMESLRHHLRNFGNSGLNLGRQRHNESNTVNRQVEGQK